MNQWLSTHLYITVTGEVVKDIPSPVPRIQGLGNWPGLRITEINYSWVQQKKITL